MAGCDITVLRCGLYMYASVKLTDQKLLKPLHCHTLTSLFLLVPHAKLPAMKEKNPTIYHECLCGVVCYIFLALIAYLYYSEEPISQIPL